MNGANQFLDLVFGYAGTQNVHAITGIGANAFPVGNAAVQGVDDIAGDDFFIGLSKNECLNADVLLMDTVDNQTGKERNFGYRVSCFHVQILRHFDLSHR